MVKGTVTRHTIKIILLVLFLMALIVSGCSILADQEAEYDSNTLRVHYIDVGQGDSILIQLPAGQNILIDAGNNGDGEMIVNYLRRQGVEKLDHVLGTHPHSDHIGGLDVVIKSFDIGRIYMPRVVHNTKTYENVLLAIKEKGMKITEAKAGVKLDTGAGVDAIIIAPQRSDYESLNNYSAVLKLTYGHTCFLFTGDAEAESEQEMLLSSVYNLRADVLKVGHHGSYSSTSEEFLQAVSPVYAVISAGRDNKYGHPHAETLTRLATENIEVLRTDERGTIVIASDGRRILFNKGDDGDIPSPPAHVSSGNGVEIMDIDLAGEIVRIKNNGAGEADLTAWELVSEKGDQRFKFPAGTIIEPGGTLQVTSGPGAKEGLQSLVWTKKYIWNDDGDPGALYDSGGRLISRFPR